MGRWQREALTEGSSTPATPHNTLRHSLRRPQHLNRRDAHHRNPHNPQRRIPALVSQRPLAHVMGDAIDLERNLRGSAIEIQHPIPDRMLTADLHPIRLKPQMSPQQRLRQTRLRTQLARQGNVTRLLWPRQDPLRHWLRQCHLPVCAAQKQGGPEGDAAKMAKSSPFSPAFAKHKRARLPKRSSLFLRSTNGEVAARSADGGVKRGKTPPQQSRVAGKPGSPWPPSRKCHALVATSFQPTVCSRKRRLGACGYSSPIRSAAMKASCGMVTLPYSRMRFLPSFCLSSSFFLRLMSPP